jgi:hypothetical protein
MFWRGKSLKIFEGRGKREEGRRSIEIKRNVKKR